MKKVAILGLHLNYGGCEQAIINTANLLCADYNVELVVSYKLTEKPAFEVNPQVKIIYLTNDTPNKKEFLNALKNKKLTLIFKEGLKSLKILYHKKRTMKKYIQKSDADIIISSRIAITKILTKYAKKNTITISVEHKHHNNDKKYLKTVKKACLNLDYLVLVSKELCNFYKKFLPNTKCIYIPNSLDYFPKNQAKLNNKNLISVGRLSPEKGFLDLIEVFKLINAQDKEYHLNIIGDGSELEKITSKIKEYKLEKYVTMHGFQNRVYINKMLLNSSLYLMCSFEESFGIVLIEAASFGLPLLAFASATGAKEIITNGKNGYLIEKRAKNEMATKVTELINNPEELAKLGNNARKTAENYSYQNIKKIWLEFLQEVKKC